MLAVGGVGIESEFRAGACAIGCKALGVDAPVMAVLVDGLPGDDKATVGLGGDVWVELLVVGACVDAELSAELGAIGCKMLGVDPPGGAVLGMGAPGDDKGPIGEDGELGFCLLVACGGSDEEFGSGGCAVGQEGAGIDAPGAAVTAVVLPGGDVAAVGQGGDGRFVLVVAEGGVVEAEFAGELVA